MDSALFPEAKERCIASIPVEPWHNGGGFTRTLIAHGGEWRVSIAEVEHDGPYSRFNGLTRVSFVLRGAGAVLRGGGDIVTLSPFNAVEYDGATAWQATLIDGPMSVLNVMSVSGRFHVRVRAVTDELTVRPGCAAAIVALDAACHCNGAHVVEANHALTIDNVRHELRVAPAVKSTPPVLVTIETL
jgi:environmental stress-induced protein Ves